MPLIRRSSPYDRAQVQDIDGTTIVPVHQPIVFNYGSADINPSHAPATCIISMLNPTLAVEGYSITINNQVIPFSNVQTGSNVKATPNTLRAIMQSLFQYLRNSPVLLNNYFFNYNSNTDEITMTARAPGTVFNITTSQSGVALYFATTNGTDSTFAMSKKRYAIEMEVFLHNGAQFEPIIQLRKEYAGVNTFEFDLRDVLRPYLTQQPPRIYPAAVFVTANSILCRYATIVSEIYTNTDGTIDSETVEFLAFDDDDYEVKMYACNSHGLPRLDFYENYAYFFNYWRRKTKPSDPDLFYEIKPLTRQPKYKLTQIHQKEWLYFVYETKPDFYDNPIIVEVEFEFISGVTSLNQFPMLTATNLAFGVYYIEVSPTILNVLTQSEKVKNYTVIIKGDIYEICRQSYTLDYDNNCMDTNGVMLIFENSMGGFDTYVPTGTMTKTEQTKQKALNTNVRFDSEPDYQNETQNKNFQVDSAITYTINTGYMDKPHANWLRELIKSKNVFLLHAQDLDMIGIQAGGYAVTPTRVIQEGNTIEIDNNEDYVESKLEFTLIWDY